MGLMGAIPYFVLLVLFIFLLYFGASKKRILPFLILAVFSGFRYKVGRDFESYEEIFEVLLRGSKDEFIEYGYFLLIKTVIFIGGNQQLVFLLMAIITQLLFYVYIKRFSIDFRLSSVIYVCVGPFFLSTFNGIRQYLALSIFLVSIKYIEKQEFFKYLLVIFIGSFFHQSIWFMLPVYFAGKKSLNVFMILLLLAGVTIISTTGVLSTLLYMTPYGGYLKREFVEFDNKIYVFMLLSLILIMLGVFYKSTDNIIFRNMNILSFVFLFVAIVSSILPAPMALRVNNYFFASYMILIPATLVQIRKKSGINHLFKWLLVMACIAYFSLLVLNDNSINPYMINLRLF